MKVLVAYDGSEAAGRALERTAQLAPGAHVTVISVVPLQPSGPHSTGPVMSGDVEAHSRELEEAVARLKSLGIEAAESLEAVGHPADAIVEEAERGGFDLVVVGSRGLHGVRALGSVSERVAHRARCSVLVVNEPTSGSAP
jgi:nucleotide-binding universal stress UspA family protein